MHVFAQVVLGLFSGGQFMLVINGLHGYDHLCFTRTIYVYA